MRAGAGGGEHRVLLTVRNVPTLPAEGGETIWWDRSLPGFYLAVYPSSTRFPQGVRSFGVWYRVNGRGRQKRLGRHPAVTLASARDRARELLQAARVRGVDLGAVARALTLAGLVEAFLVAARAEKPRTRSDSTINGYEQMFTADVKKSTAGRMPIEELRQRDLRGLLATISRRAPVVARRVRQLLVVAAKWGLREEIIERDPVAGLAPQGRPSSRERVLRDEEIVILWRACAEESTAVRSMAEERGRDRKKKGVKPRDRKESEMAAAAQRAALARFLLLTGQRVGETSLMEWREIARDEKLWHIPAEHRKGQRGRRRGHIVPLSEGALEELRLWSLHPGATDKVRVFPWALANHRHWLDPLRSRAKALGLEEHWTPHDLRRTAATGMARLGTYRSVIAMILGHTMQEGGAVTFVYDRADRLPERAAALEAWGLHVTALGGRTI